jgi:Domain of unknown function (DUF4157)
MFAPRARVARHGTPASAKKLSVPEPAEQDHRSREGLNTGTPTYQYDLASLPILPPSGSQIPSTLAIGSVHDPSEREADNVAAGVVPINPKSASNPQPRIQRTPVAPRVSRSAPPIVHQVLRTPGQPLTPAARAIFEPRLGYDLSRVRIHADAQAAESAESVNARAYTVANQIVFAPGQYGHTNPDRARLLAHELTHVIQQSASPAAHILRRQPTTVEVDSNKIDLPTGQSSLGAVIYKYSAHTTVKPTGGRGAGTALDIDLPLLVYPPPKIDSKNPTVDIFIFFHGMRATYNEETPEMEQANTGKGYTKDPDQAKETIGEWAHLQEAAASSGGRLVIAPQGPTTWVNRGGKVGWTQSSGNWTEALEASGFDSLIDAALDGLTKDLKLPTPLKAGSIHVAGHSAGGRGIVEAVKNTKYGDSVQDVTLQDAGYGGVEWKSLLDWMLDGSPGKTARVLMSSEGGKIGAAGNVNTRVVLDSALNKDAIKAAIKKKKLTDRFEVVSEEVPKPKDRKPMPDGFHLESHLTIRDKNTGGTQATIVAFYSPTSSHYPTVTGTLAQAAKSGPGDTTDFLGDISPGKYRTIADPKAGKIRVFNDEKLRKKQLTLDSGTPVEVLAVSTTRPDAVQIQMEDGTQGWMSSKDLSGKR